MVTTQEAAHGRQPSVVFLLQLRLTIWLSVGHHRTEFQNIKWPPAQSYTLLGIYHASFSLHLQGQSYHY